MNYPVLQGLNHDDMQDAYGPLWGIPVTTSFRATARSARSTPVSRPKRISKKRSSPFCDGMIAI